MSQGVVRVWRTGDPSLQLFAPPGNSFDFFSDMHKCARPAGCSHVDACQHRHAHAHSLARGKHKQPAPSLRTEEGGSAEVVSTLGALLTFLSPLRQCDALRCTQDMTTPAGTALLGR